MEPNCVGSPHLAGFCDMGTVTFAPQPDAHIDKKARMSRAPKPQNREPRSPTRSSPLAPSLPSPPCAAPRSDPCIDLSSTLLSIFRRPCHRCSPKAAETIGCRVFRVIGAPCAFRSSAHFSGSATRPAISVRPRLVPARTPTLHPRRHDPVHFSVSASCCASSLPNTRSKDSARVRQPIRGRRRLLRHFFGHLPCSPLPCSELAPREHVQVLPFCGGARLSPSFVALKTTNSFQVSAYAALSRRRMAAPVKAVHSGPHP